MLGGEKEKERKKWKPCGFGDGNKAFFEVRGPNPRMKFIKLREKNGSDGSQHEEY